MASSSSPGRSPVAVDLPDEVSEPFFKGLGVVFVESQCGPRDDSRLHCAHWPAERLTRTHLFVRSMRSRG